MIRKRNIKMTSRDINMTHTCKWSFWEKTLPQLIQGCCLCTPLTLTCTAKFSGSTLTWLADRSWLCLIFSAWQSGDTVLLCILALRACFTFGSVLEGLDRGEVESVGSDVPTCRGSEKKEGLWSCELGRRGSDEGARCGSEELGLVVMWSEEEVEAGEGEGDGVL